MLGIPFAMPYSFLSSSTFSAGLYKKDCFQPLRYTLVIILPLPLCGISFLGAHSSSQSLACFVKEGVMTMTFQTIVLVRRHSLPSLFYCLPSLFSMADITAWNKLFYVIYGIKHVMQVIYYTCADSHWGRTMRCPSLYLSVGSGTCNIKWIQWRCFYFILFFANHTVNTQTSLHYSKLLSLFLFKLKFLFIQTNLKTNFYQKNKIIVKIFLGHHWLK